MPRLHPLNGTNNRRVLDELRCSPQITAPGSVCRGYPGGPIICGTRVSKLCGVNMFEYGNYEPGEQNPAVYTELKFYSTWIKDKLKCACASAECKSPKPNLATCSKAESTADPKLANVVKYTFDIGYMTGSPDGVKVSHILGINGQFPGPTIHALPGDILEVTVNNKMSDNQTTTIHWHGIPQASTPFEDGPAFVSQCPIVSGSQQIYRFPVQHSGTYWYSYHSHVGSQYTEGLLGLIIVHNINDEVYFDTEFYITLQEWYHNSARANDAWHLSPASHGAPPFPNSGLMNGVGRFNCSQTNLSCDTRQQKHPVFSLRRGEVNKVRLANVGGYSTYNVSIEGHRLKVMEVDGIESNNRTVTHGVFLGAGQRYSLILELLGNTDKSEYFIFANIRSEFMYLPNGHANINSNPSGIQKTIVGLIRYVPVSQPLQRLVRNVSGGKNVTEVVPIFEQFPYSANLPSIPSDTAYLSSFAIKAKYSMAPPPQKADVTHVLNLDFIDMPDGVRRGVFNGVPFIMPSEPRKPLLMRVLDDELFPSSTPFIEVEYGQVVDIVVNNLPAGPHPIHLHGHHFWPVAGGPGVYNASKIRSKRPMWSLVKRDTMMVKERSYAVLRFVADNPGVWPLHCHIDWHQLSGMKMVIKEAVAVARMVLSVPEQQARLCRENKVSNVYATPSGNVWFSEVPLPTSPSCATIMTCESQRSPTTCPSLPFCPTCRSFPTVGLAFSFCANKNSALHWRDGNNRAVKWAPGCDYVDRTHAHKLVVDWQCGGACLAQYNCTHFAWSFRKGGTCYLMEGQGDWSYQGLDLTHKTDTTQCGYVVARHGYITWEDGVTGRYKWADSCDYSNDDIASVGSAQNECAELCRARAECTHFTWTPDNGGICWMKRGEGNWGRSGAFKTRYPANCGFLTE